MDANQDTILLVDDDANFRKVAAFNLQRLGWSVLTAADGEEALVRLGEGGIDLLLTDVKMPRMDGLTLLMQVRANWPNLPVLLLTAHGDVEMAVEAMQAGAVDFITKPFERERLAAKIERALRPTRLERENRRLREALDSHQAGDDLVGASPPMRRLKEIVARIAPREATVLILGESGSGKEVVARALHSASARRKGPFVAVNCAAIPAALLESELFGHARGAFTGAVAAHEGRFQQASGGTLLLDEIGDMPLALQAKLLRVVQERSVEPVGSGRSQPVDVRIIAATNQDLAARVQAGEFREDLYYRLNVVPLTVPPLRERTEDIPLLVRHFLEQAGEAALSVEPNVIDALTRADWPGNVRELFNVLERALALRAQSDRLTLEDLHLPSPARGPRGHQSLEVPEEGLVLDDVERQLIESALQRTGGNQTRAAALLGITRQKLIYRMQKYGIG